MANLTTEEALNLLCAGMYSGRDVMTYDYSTALEIYNAFRELAWLHKCRNDRIEELEAALDDLCGYVSRADWALMVSEKTKQTIAALEGKDER
jgi:hypothetical protein